MSALSVYCQDFHVFYGSQLAARRESAVEVSGLIGIVALSGI